ncbi:hypothetical protein vseg_020322 [Gypsophila vaccaria]
MGFHLLVVMAKLKLTKVASHGCTPIIVSLIFPFILRMSCSVRIIRQAYVDLFYSSRLFFFQLTQIVLDDNGTRRDPSNNNRVLLRSIDSSGSGSGRGNGSSSSGARWDRALRLVSERLTRTRRHLASMRFDEDDEASFHEFSMIAL